MFENILFRLKSLYVARKYLRSHSLRKLQIGCGPFPMDGWLNGDNLSAYSKQYANKIYLDATKPLSFADNTFDYIFSEHLIEHISFEQAESMLEECYRVCKPGARIRISTPNLAFLIELYASEKTKVQEAYIEWAHQSFSESVQRSRDTFVINNFFRCWGHSFIFDFETLKDLLSSVGFVQIEQFDVGKSVDPNLVGIEQHGKEIPEEFNRLETMCIEACKPRN